MLDHPRLRLVAARYHATPAQIALAWLLQQKDIIVIPKASRTTHVQENRTALDLKLTKEDFMELDRAFPPPHRKMPLAMR